VSYLTDHTPPSRHVLHAHIRPVHGDWSGAPPPTNGRHRLRDYSEITTLLCSLRVKQTPVNCCVHGDLSQCFRPSAMSVSVENERTVDGGSGDVWNTPRTWRQGSSVETRLSPGLFNHVASSSSPPAAGDCAASQLSGLRRGDVNSHRSRRLTSFSVADILGPRYGCASPQRHSDDCSDDSTPSNDDLSSSVLSHTSSTDGPSPTGSDRDRCCAEKDSQLSTSRKFVYYYVICDNFVHHKQQPFTFVTRYSHYCRKHIDNSKPSVSCIRIL